MAVSLSLAGVDAATLSVWLRQAQAALQALVTGQQVTTASYSQGEGQRMVTYRRADVVALRAWILELQAAVNPGSSTSGRRPPIFPRF